MKNPSLPKIATPGHKPTTKNGASGTQTPVPPPKKETAPAPAAAPVANAAPAPAPKKRRSAGVSTSRVLQAFLLAPNEQAGVDAVRALNPSRLTTRQVLKLLAQSNKTSTLFEAYAAERGLNTRAAKGRGTPAPGEQRVYRVQQVRNSGPFLRLPLEALGVSKGECVIVSFEDGRLLVEAPSAAPASPVEVFVHNVAAARETEASA